MIPPGTVCFFMVLNIQVYTGTVCFFYVVEHTSVQRITRYMPQRITRYMPQRLTRYMPQRFICSVYSGSPATCSNGSPATCLSGLAALPCRLAVPRPCLLPSASYRSLEFREVIIIEVAFSREMKDELQLILRFEQSKTTVKQDLIKMIGELSLPRPV